MWTYREVAILTLSDSQLIFKVSNTIEFEMSIELLVSFPVAVYNFSVILRRVWFAVSSA